MYTCFLCKQDFLPKAKRDHCPTCRIEIFDISRPAFITDENDENSIFLIYQEEFYMIFFTPKVTEVYKGVPSQNGKYIVSWIQIITLPCKIPLTTNLQFILALS